MRRRHYAVFLVVFKLAGCSSSTEKPLARDLAFQCAVETALVNSTEKVTSGIAMQRDELENLPHAIGAARKFTLDRDGRITSLGALLTRVKDPKGKLVMQLFSVDGSFPATHPIAETVEHPAQEVPIELIRGQEYFEFEFPHPYPALSAGKDIFAVLSLSAKDNATSSAIVWQSVPNNSTVTDSALDMPNRVFYESYSGDWKDYPTMDGFTLGVEVKRCAR